MSGTAHVDPSNEVQRLRSLYNLLEALAGTREPSAIYQAAITALLSSTDADRAAVLIFDADGVMRFKAWRGLSDVYREAVTGHTPWKAGTKGATPLRVPDVIADPGLAEFQDTIRAEGIGAMVFVPLEASDGVFGKFMLYYAEPHTCSDSELSMAQAVAHHISIATERLRADEARESSEHRLQAILDNSAAVIYLKDLDGRYLLVNRHHEELFGVAQADMLGKTDYDVFAKEIADRFRANDQKALEARGPISMEERAPHADGIHSYISVKFPLLGPDGNATGVCGISTDITDRVLLLAREQEARRMSELLNRIGQRLVSELDLEKLVQAVTDKATDLMGAEFGAFFHNQINDKGESYMLYSLSGVPREAFANFPMPRATEMFGPTFRGEGVVRCDDVTKDPRYGQNPPYHGKPKGHLPVSSYLAAPVISRSGNVLGGLFFGHSQPGKFTKSHEEIVVGIAAQAAIAMDNAQLFEHAGRVQAELKRSNEELRRANRDLETFAYSASHDLQEPLRTITISAQLLDAHCAASLDEASRAFLDRILGSANRMISLVKDLLAYTELTRFPEASPRSTVESGVVLAAVLDSMRATIQQTGATVTSTALPIVDVHETRLAQVFQNLIGNAIKYRGEESPRVHITAENRDEWTVFSVSDNGLGIDMRYGEQIFGLFKRLHTRESSDGSGIGLAICRRLVEQYGGRIWLEQSAPGTGSTFCFSIPRSET